MSVIQRQEPSLLAVFRRQLAVCAAFALLLAIIVAGLYLQDRRREWTLRKEQAKHRLDVTFELISRELDRVRADTLFLANQQSVRQFVHDDERRLTELEKEFANFVRRKETYDQIRLLDLNGREIVRVNYAREQALTVEPPELQDKSDRYYFRAARPLPAGQVFVSDFDLNLEHGQIERPLKPVIRFVTPVAGDDGETTRYLVLNYLGASLLRELDDSTLPGFTILLRPDGNYLRSPEEHDAWGWLLGHQRTFATQFPDEWAAIDQLTDCRLTSHGAFAARQIVLGNKSAERAPHTGAGGQRGSIILVAYLPRDQVFVASNKSLGRLLLLAGCAFVPLAVFARYWAHATLGRQLQTRLIATSEERLRELSSRLLRIQEDERRAISREIHDELGQQVTAINLDLKLAERNFASRQATPHLERAIRENEELLQTLHAFATRVRPAVLDDLGLKDAVESHIWDFQQRTGIDVCSDLGFQSTEIPGEVADNAYRLVQESLNNVARHADASKVWIRLSIDNDDAVRQLHIEIRDNGRGYESNEHKGQRLGLVGMRERVDLLAGELRMESDVDRGTNIQIRLPLRDHPSDSEEQQV